MPADFLRIMSKLLPNSTVGAQFAEFCTILGTTVYPDFEVSLAASWWLSRQRRSFSGDPQQHHDRLHS